MVTDFQPDPESEKHLQSQSARCQGTDSRKSKTDEQADRSQELENASQLSVTGKSEALELPLHMDSHQTTCAVTEERERTEKIENEKHQVTMGFARNPVSDPPLEAFRRANSAGQYSTLNCEKAHFFQKGR